MCVADRCECCILSLIDIVVQGSKIIARLHLVTTSVKHVLSAYALSRHRGTAGERKGNSKQNVNIWLAFMIMMYQREKNYQMTPKEVFSQNMFDLASLFL